MQNISTNNTTVQQQQTGALRTVKGEVPWVPIDVDEDTPTENQHPQQQQGNLAALEPQYALVVNEVTGEAIELPINYPEKTLSLNTLNRSFPGAHGLKYRAPETGAIRGLGIDSNDTNFMEPPGGWAGKTFIVIFPDGHQHQQKQGQNLEQRGPSNGGFFGPPEAVRVPPPVAPLEAFPIRTEPKPVPPQANSLIIPNKEQQKLITNGGSASHSVNNKQQKKADEKKKKQKNDHKKVDGVRNKVREQPSMTLRRRKKERKCKRKSSLEQGAQSAAQSGLPLRRSKRLSTVTPRPLRRSLRTAMVVNNSKPVVASSASRSVELQQQSKKKRDSGLEESDSESEHSEVENKGKNARTFLGNIDGYTCDKCPYQTQSYGRLSTHLSKHGARKAFQCSQCNFASDKQDAVSYHEKSVHDED